MKSVLKITTILSLVTLSFLTFGQKVYIQRAALYKDSLLFYGIGTTSVNGAIPAKVLDYYPEHQSGVFKIQIENVDSLAFCENRLLYIPHYNINVDKNEKINKIDTLICFVHWRDIAVPEEAYEAISKLKTDKDSLYRAYMKRR